MRKSTKNSITQKDNLLTKNVLLTTLPVIFPKKPKNFCLKSGKVEKVVIFLRDMYFLKMFFRIHNTQICQQCRTILTKTDDFFLKVAKIVFERFSVSRSILLLNCTLHFSEQC